MIALCFYFSLGQFVFKHSFFLSFFFFKWNKFIFSNNFCKLQRQNTKLQHITFQYLTRVLVINTHPETRSKATPRRASYKNVSSFIYSAAFLCGGGRGCLYFLKCCDKRSFHISLEHFWNCLTIIKQLKKSNTKL